MPGFDYSLEMDGLDVFRFVAPGFRLVARLRSAGWGRAGGVPAAGCLGAAADFGEGSWAMQWVHAVGFCKYWVFMKQHPVQDIRFVVNMRVNMV